VYEIESPFDAVQAPIDLIETPVHAVEASGLARNLHLQVADLRHDVPHRSFEPEDARPESLVDLRYKAVDGTSHVPQVLKSDIAGSSAIRPV
jgi:hypothetical protein